MKSPRRHEHTARWWILGSICALVLAAVIVCLLTLEADRRRAVADVTSAVSAVVVALSAVVFGVLSLVRRNPPGQS